MFNKLFSYKLNSSIALFTRPETKTGGERFSYQVPTYEALRGITCSIFWKPSIDIFISRIRVLNEIKMITKNKKRLIYNDGDKSNLVIYGYLSNVSYEVEFGYEFNQFSKINNDIDNIKYDSQINRAIENGGRRDIYLGIKECQGYIEPCKYGISNSIYNNVNMDFGYMFHSFEYQKDKNGIWYSNEYKSPKSAFFWNQQMINGEIVFPNHLKNNQNLIKKDFKI